MVDRILKLLFALVIFTYFIIVIIVTCMCCCPPDWMVAPAIGILEAAEYVQFLANPKVGREAELREAE